MNGTTLFSSITKESYEYNPYVDAMRIINNTDVRNASDRNKLIRKIENLNGLNVEQFGILNKMIDAKLKSIG